MDCATKTDGPQTQAQIKTHPAADIFPLASKEEYQALKLDIERNGLQELPALYRGQLLDGRNRLCACFELGFQPDFYALDDDIDPVSYVLSRNLYRRHLTSSQRATVAADALPLIEAEAKKRKAAGQKSGGKARHSASVKELTKAENDGRAAEKAAKLTGTNRQYVADAKKIKAADPEAFEEIKGGKTTISKAKRKLTANKVTLATKATTTFTEHWRCLNCGSAELHRCGYCKPCWESASEEQRGEILGGEPFKCRNCGHDVIDADGDACAKCKEPLKPPGGAPEPKEPMNEAEKARCRAGSELYKGVGLLHVVTSGLVKRWPQHWSSEEMAALFSLMNDVKRNAERFFKNAEVAPEAEPSAIDILRRAEKDIASARKLVIGDAAGVNRYQRNEAQYRQQARATKLSRAKSMISKIREELNDTK